MTESKSATPAAQKKLVAITDAGVADAKRFHLYSDCGTLRDRGPDDFEEVSDREARLLGLKVCTVCERRATGGPAITALTELLTGPDFSNQTPADEAWYIVEKLKERGFYIAQRKLKDA